MNPSGVMASFLPTRVLKIATFSLSLLLSAAVSVHAQTQQPARPGSREPARPGTTQDFLGWRRYLTVMFCDLVGSTGIAAKLDAEECRDLVGAYLDAATAAVTDMGGKVAKKLGDGLMALFGYPVAQE